MAAASRSKKTEVIEDLFNSRWDTNTRTVSDFVVTADEVGNAIRQMNRRHPNRIPLSDRNTANFLKDIIRRTDSANRIWPTSVAQRGYTARQLTGEGLSFEFIPLDTTGIPFPAEIPPPSDETPRFLVESVSLPLASRRLGRADESWLMQVLVRLRVIETHLSVVSKRAVVQLDHLQMRVQLARTEIDALFLVTEDVGGNETREVIVCCEAKGRNDDILRSQILREVQGVFRLPGVTQNIAIPIAVKAFARSHVHVVEFEVVTRDDVEELETLTVASDAVYEFKPSIPGIGE